MNFRTILKRYGIVSRREVEQVVSAAKERFEKLPSSHTHWDGNRLDKEARELLRACDASSASNRLATTIAASPAAYILGWSNFYENVETCCQMVLDRLGELPDSQMSLRVERIKTDVVKLLDTMSVAEATSQLIAQIQKRPVIYINGVATMLAHQHLPLIVAVCERDIGGDWEVNVDLVMSRLEELFNEEESSENAIKQMFLDISEAEKGYLRPKIELAKQMAKVTVSQLMPSLQAGLPAGVHLLEFALEAAILRLLTEGMPMKRLVEKLLDEIKKSPFNYITMPPKTTPSREHQAVDYAQKC